MGKVVVDITMSLDGFVTAPNDGPGNGLGDGGMVLHAWARESRTDADMKFLDTEAIKNIGATVLGRRTFDIAEAAWGNQPPFVGQVFVLTHRPYETLRRGPATFVFVTDGLESAHEQAQAAAGNKVVNLMGANISQQYLSAGLVDEIQLHIANIVLGRGRPLFANINRPIQLERIQVVPTPAATHLRYRVVKPRMT